MNVLIDEVGKKSAGEVESDMNQCNCFRSELTGSRVS